MQSTQKYIVGISVIAIFALLGYLTFQNSTSPQSGEGKNSEIKTSIPKSGTGDTTIETDTRKRLETLANSGTAWDMSPFGSGKPLEEAEKKPIFQKPNTEWKTRTLNINGKSITYVFGEGNPKEVALTATGVQQELRECDITPGSKARICREGMYGYLTPEIELALKRTLESSLWEKLIMECHKEYISSPEYDLFHHAILSPNALDISHFVILDNSTGRKELDTIYFDGIYNAIVTVGIDIRDSRNGNARPTTDGIFYPCFEKYGKPLAVMLENVRVAYTSNVAFASQDNRFANSQELSETLNRGLSSKYFLINP